MLRSLITAVMSGNSEAILQTVIFLLMWVVIVLISLSFHESAHAYMAAKLGDPTARNLGRVTMNPAKHLDPVGFIVMLLIGFGWAKPCPINARNFENPRKGMALSALAGPVSNLILALCCAIIASGVNIGASFVQPLSTSYEALFYIFQFFYYGIYLNIALAIFNFIPVPPLDGSRILGLLLPPKYYFAIMKYERFIGLGFMLIVIVLAQFHISVISWIVDPVTDGLLWLGGVGEYFGIFHWLS